MGDVRYDAPLRAVKDASDRIQALHALADEEVIAALAASARSGDPYLSNVLATEAHNRVLRMRAITDSMSEGVVAATADGRIVYVNPAAERIFGVDRAAFFEGRAEALLHVSPESLRRYRQILTEQYRARGAARIEFEMRRADGTRFWTEQTLTALRNAAGDEAGWVLVIHDVTEPRALRERLSRANALHEAVFTSVPVIAIVVDRDLRVVRANPAFTLHRGIPEEAVLGMPLTEVLRVYPENEVAIRAALATGRTFESVGEPDPAGQRLWDWSAVPLRDPDGQVGGLLITALDTTDRHNAQKGFLQAPK
jgi:PAS domain S-box-containing protein